MKTALMTFLLLSGAASADPRNPKPDWVDGQSMEYPRETHIIGVGVGDDRNAAQERSRGEISKVFSSDVKVDTSLHESESNGEGKASYSQSIAQSVRTLSEKVLEGVQVVENWQDSATRLHYALAVLDRAKARAALADKIGELDKEAKALKDELSQGADKLARAKAAMRALAVMRARSGLNAELRIVDAGGKGLETPFDEGALKTEAGKAVAALDVAVDMSGDGSQDLETGVVRGLTALGLRATVGAGKAADIAVEGKVETTTLPGDGSKWKWARSSVTVSVKDARSGKTVSRFDASDREASANIEEAVRRTRAELAKRMSSQISAAVTAYFEN